MKGITVEALMKWLKDSDPQAIVYIHSDELLSVFEPHKTHKFLGLGVEVDDETRA